ncbi:RagB/SusD family nutrient uptake outer membrane protein [Pedobacter metabolipauper]|uniref:Putative outer membrane starch-binding protein n=1 Tax=Pedobacter metabolipauper TaxID=425513 RepID=A0A4R6T1J8_9SPHI|nr:RagB/SusD family nutrient uptake outer membrane protein [Pedobacter metabolipauper]TDQ11518.1 putative outer membrane starch-binding protein [Pedobacter metabolipauper]
MKLSIYFVLIVMLLGLNSCSKFLDTKPTDFQTTEDYYDSEENLLKVLAGAYSPLSTASMYGDALWNQIGAGTDEHFRSVASSTTGVWVNNFDYTSVDVNNLWQQCYIGIERANGLIANINIANIDEVKRQAILGEALFLRGYYYFILVSYYGGVPLKTTPTTNVNVISIPRATDREVYAQILTDMTAAEQKVYTTKQISYASRVTKTTVEGILARVCLTMAGYPLLDKSMNAEALKWAKKVRDSGEHTLITDIAGKADGDNTSGYSQLFVNEAQDKYDIREAMWESEQKGNRTDGYISNGRVGNNIGVRFTGTVFADTGYCYGNLRVTERLYKLYANGDTRRDWNCGKFTYDANAKRTYFAANKIYDRNAAKWRRSYETLYPKDKNYTPINFPILRYSDVLLMLAEADNEANGSPSAEAYAAVNMVRRRAYKLPLGAASAVADVPADLGYERFRAMIQDERSRELCFEALRRSDLIRWGIYVTRMKEVAAQFTAYNGTYAYAAIAGNNTDERHLIFPIPSGEISVNRAAIQNTGW